MRRPAVTAVFAVLSAASLALTFLSLHRRSEEAERSDFLRFGLEDTARRVSRATANLRNLEDNWLETVKVRDRGLARLLKDDPSLKSDPRRLAAIEERLKPKELHFCDGDGLRLAEIANVERLSGLQSIADSAERIYPAKVDIGAPHSLPKTADSMQSCCEGNRIRMIPLRKPSPLASTEALWLLVALDALFALLLFSAFLPALWRRVRAQAQLLPLMVRRPVAVRGVRLFSWRITLTVTIVSAVSLALFWRGAYRVCRDEAENVLALTSNECRNEIRQSIDSILFYIGYCICERYGVVSAITDREVPQIMREYNVDEINVENEKGIITASSIGISGKDNSQVKGPAEFFQRIVQEGRSTFSQDYRESVDEKDVIRKYVGVAFNRDGGFIQLGFDKKRLLTDYRRMFEGFADGWSFGKRGFVLTFREGDFLVESCVHPAFTKGMSLAEVGLAGMPPVESVFEADLFGERCLCYAIDEAYRKVLLAIPIAEIRDNCIESVRGLTLAAVIVFLLVLWLLNRLFSIHSSLRAFVREDAERRHKALATARTIQLSSLPAVFPDEPDFKIFARMTPAREVGGDFFDCFYLNDSKLCFLIADVSGKGVPAAMFMMKAKTEIRESAMSGASLGEAVTQVNRLLAEHNDADMFITVWIGCYDRLAGRVEYVNAGHNPPLVRRRDGNVEWIRGRRSLPLAAMSGVKYQVQEIALAPGDSIFLYTDGVTEATDSAGEFYGDERLEKAMTRGGSDFVSAIDADLSSFVAGAEQADDITMFALDRKEAQK